MDMTERDKEIWKKPYVWSGRCTYGRRRKKIVVVMDAEGNIIGIIKTMADIEAKKNDTYTI